MDPFIRDTPSMGVPRQSISSPSPRSNRVVGRYRDPHRSVILVVQYFSHSGWDEDSFQVESLERLGQDQDLFTS